MSIAGPAKKWTIAAVAILFTILAAELFFSIRQGSQTFDESAHLYSGYLYWKYGDFGINPEHPPLVKLVAALPILPTGVPVTPPPPIFFRAASAGGGSHWLYANDADALLFRARVAVSTFTFVLALLVFLAANEMFGAGAALIALLLFVFEPNILANGALVTTDTGASCFAFASVYAFYRYCRVPSVPRLCLCGVAVGLFFATKHSAVLIVPVLLVLVITELLRRRAWDEGRLETRKAQALRLLIAITVIAVMSITILWSFYGFRYAARPGNQQITPPTQAFLQGLDHPFDKRAIGLMEEHRLLPEAYLYGLTDIVNLTHTGRSMFLLGQLYASGRWFYFPIAFAIKTTLAFLVLLVLVFAARRLWRADLRREFLFLAIPAAIWLAASMSSKLDLGIRHILPMFPFLIVLAGAAAWMLARQSKPWAWAIALLLACHVFSSVRAYPDYLPYSNEAFGGSSKTYKVLADSNVGWEDGLSALQRYVSSHHITHCWLAYSGPVDPSYYHLPCGILPTFFAEVMRRPIDVVSADRADIDGPVFIGSMMTTGGYLGPGTLDPYAQFVNQSPSEVIKGEILVFNGKFHVPDLAGESHAVQADNLSHQGKLAEAIQEAQIAVRVEPGSLDNHALLSTLYSKHHQPEEAMREYQAAMRIYQTVQPDFQAVNPPPDKPVAE